MVCTTKSVTNCSTKTNLRDVFFANAHEKERTQPLRFLFYSLCQEIQQCEEQKYFAFVYPTEKEKIKQLSYTKKHSYKETSYNR